MASLREVAAKRKAGMSPADLLTLARAARFGMREGDALVPSRGAVEALWGAHAAELVDAYRRRPSLAHAFAVAELSEDRALRRAAGRWLAWWKRQPDPRPTALDDTPIERFVAWRAAEPSHLP